MANLVIEYDPDLNAPKPDEVGSSATVESASDEISLEAYEVQVQWDEEASTTRLLQSLLDARAWIVLYFAGINT